jgi:hypothetical protein
VLFKEQTADWIGVIIQFVDLLHETLWKTTEYCIQEVCKRGIEESQLVNFVKGRLKEKVEKFRRTCYDLLDTEQSGLQVIAGERDFLDEIHEARTLRFINVLAMLEKESQIAPPTCDNKNICGQSISATSTDIVLAFKTTASGGGFGKKSPWYTTTDTIQSIAVVQPDEFARANKDKLKAILNDDRQTVYQIMTRSRHIIISQLSGSRMMCVGC